MPKITGKVSAIKNCVCSTRFKIEIIFNQLEFLANIIFSPDMRMPVTNFLTYFYLRSVEFWRNMIDYINT
jgi:hypothetical protein